MDYQDIPEYLRTPYTAECPCCGLIQEILTQSDNDPEYYTEVYLKCQCGEYLQFDLPVN